MNKLNTTKRAVMKGTPKNYRSVKVRQPTLKEDVFNTIGNVLCPSGQLEPVVRRFCQTKGRIEMKTKETVLEKHCPSMNNLYLDDAGRAFRDRIISAMEEYAKQFRDQLDEIKGRAKSA